MQGYKEDFLNWEYAEKLTEKLYDDTTKDTMKEYLLQAFKELQRIGNKYFNEFMYNSKFLVENIIVKKADYLLNAKNKKEIIQILKPSSSHYNGYKFEPMDTFHIEEEELLMLSMACLEAPLKGAAFDRFMELFVKFYPEHKDIIMNRKI